MSLFKTLTGLAQATVLLAKEDKDFRKELALNTVTMPIAFTKNVVDYVDNATKATERLESVVTQVGTRHIAQEIYKGNYTDFTVSE